MRHVISDMAILIKLNTQFYCEQLKNTLSRYSSCVLFITGGLLIVAGTLAIAQGQTDPVRLETYDPEGVCCVGMPEPVLFVLPPEPILVVLGPEQLNTIDPEIVNVDPGQIAAIDPIDPEPLEADYDDTLNRFAAGNLLMFIEGSFGALIMITAGLGAIIAGAFGAYKAAISLLFVAVGAFILRALVSLFFGTNYDAYSAGGIEFVGGGL